MTEKNSPCFARNPRRAFFKGSVVVAGLMAFALILWALFNHGAVDQLKFNMSLSSLIAVVLLINLASFACFVILYAAYQWVRSDLKCPRSEDHSEKDD